MYQLVVFSAILALATASPGNLGLGYANGLGGGYSGGLGLAAGYNGNQVTVASGSVAAAPVVAAVPYVAAAPVATSSQARVDLITPSQIITQVSAVPVALAGGYGGYGGVGSAGGASGLGAVGVGYGGAASVGYGGAAGLGYGAGAGGHGN